MDNTGKSITLSAEWAVKDLEGLIVLRMRPPELKKPGRDVPSPAWKARLRFPRGLDDQGQLVDLPDPSPRAQIVAERLRDKRFLTRRETLLAISVELWRLNLADAK